MHSWGQAQCAMELPRRCKHARCPIAQALALLLWPAATVLVLPPALPDLTQLILLAFRNALPYALFSLLPMGPQHLP